MPSFQIVKFLFHRFFVVDKATVKLATKTCNLFRKFLQNKLKSDVARFSTHVQTCRATNQVVASMNTDSSLDKITGETGHTQELRHLLQSKFALGR